jgi:hypothetical protein
VYCTYRDTLNWIKTTGKQNNESWKAFLAKRFDNQKGLMDALSRAVTGISKKDRVNTLVLFMCRIYTCFHQMFHMCFIWFISFCCFQCVCEPHPRQIFLALHAVPNIQFLDGYSKLSVDQREALRHIKLPDGVKISANKLKLYRLLKLESLPKCVHCNSVLNARRKKVLLCRLYLLPHAPFSLHTSSLPYNFIHARMCFT